MYHSLPDSYMEQYLNDNNFCMWKKNQSIPILMSWMVSRAKRQKFGNPNNKSKIWTKYSQNYQKVKAKEP